MEDHTFVIPVYNQAPYLEACIQSLVAQTVKSEIIITTPTPLDVTKSIAEKYNIPYIINNTDKTHVAHNFNFALSKATTALVTIAHQDDIYEAKYAETIIKNYARYNKKDVLIAFTSYTDLIDGKPRNFSLSAFVKNALLFPFVFSKTISSRSLKKLILLFGNPICCPSVTFNTRTIGDFRFLDKYSCAVDWHAWYLLAKREGSFLYIGRKLIKRRLHLRSETTKLLKSGQTKQDELDMFELMWGSKRSAKIMARIYAIGHNDNLV